MRCERDGTGCGVREYRFPVGVYRFSERAAASRWVYCVSRRGMSFLGGCIVFFGEAWRCSVFCQYARGECVVSVRRAGMLGRFAVSVRRAGMLGCFAVSVRGVMSCG